jgi:hypothetical protein
MILKAFGKTLDRMGKGTREDGNGNRRQITLHSYRNHSTLNAKKGTGTNSKHQIYSNHQVFTSRKTLCMCVMSAT